jgi:penicillin-binding protein 2
MRQIRITFAGLAVYALATCASSVERVHLRRATLLLPVWKPLHLAVAGHNLQSFTLGANGMGFNRVAGHRFSNWMKAGCVLGLMLAVGLMSPASASLRHHVRLRHNAAGANATVHKAAKHPVGQHEVNPHAKQHVRHVSETRLVRGHNGRLVRVAMHRHYYERFTASSFANNLTQGDMIAGEDPAVRAAAVEALGNMNGTVVAIDPSTGRVLAMVNQKLALSSGAEPCSTIKLSVAIAALQEGLVKRDTPVDLGHGYHVTLTEALAHSNNLYFETVGRTLGFERVKHYANSLGLGELAGYNIAGEQLGAYPDHALPDAMGGVGRMCSFGESVSMTPLQLGAIVSAIANGGTLYYLQHPTSEEDVSSFEPKIKRTLDIASLLPEMRDGMAGAVQYGTARSLRTSFKEFPVLGKTGTCSNNGTRFGWFGSYADTPKGRIVTVVFLEGGRPTFGPKAAELTGDFYRALYDSNYFAPPVEQGTALAMGTR